MWLSGGAHFILNPFVDLQLETATNHHRSLAVLKFLVPLHLTTLVCKERLVFSISQPDTAIFSVKLIN